VPFFTEAQLSENKNNFRNLRNNIFTLVFFGLLFITGLFYYFSSELINIFAFGFDSKTKEISSDLLKRMSPFLFLISLSALNMGLLNSIKKFNPPAFSPVLMNVGIIFVVLVSYYFFSLNIYILSYAVLFGALLQYAFQIPFIFNNNLGYFFVFSNCFNSKTKEIFTVIFPQIFGLAVYNINILINTQFASYMEKGSITYLYLAERLIEFPLGVFAVAIGTTMLPGLSKQYLNNDYLSFSKTINNKLKFLIFLTTPFAIAFIFLGEELCDVLYVRGEFSVTDSLSTYRALVGYSFGLIFVAGLRLLTQGFYAAKITRVPVVYGAYNLVINLALCYFLTFYFDFGFFGLALASSLSSMLLFSTLFLKLKSLISGINILDFIKYFLKICGLSSFSIITSLAIVNFLFNYQSSLFLLIITVIISTIIFSLLAKALKLKELSMIFK